MARSKCCDAEALIVMTLDFPGDDVRIQEIGTCHYKCKKCGEPCDIKEE